MIRKNARLGDVAEFIRGITFEPKDVHEVVKADLIGCMRTKNVQEKLDLNDVWGLDRRLVKNKNQFLIEGDLLISTANSWNLVGKACWVPRLSYESTFGGFISVLRVNQQLVHQKYFYYWFTSKYIQELVRSFGQKTTNISNLNFSRVLNLEIPLPSLAEQHRIAKILDDAELLKAKREMTVSKLNDLAQSIYKENFLKLPIIKLGEICTFQNGGTPSKSISEYWDGNIPWISSADIVDNEIVHDRNFITQEGLDNSATNLSPKGSILVVTRTGVGKVAITRKPTAYSQDVVALTLKKGFDTNFVAEALKFNQPMFLSNARGATIKGITRGVLESAAIPSVDQKSQEAFGALIGAINQNKENLLKADNKMNSFLLSLQQSAFSGKL